MSNQNKVPVSLKLDPEIRDLAVQVARAKGMDLSEHIRGLIVDDLDRHGLPAPHIFVREGKVGLLKANRALSRAYFISVNWADGSVLFLPARKALECGSVDWYEPGARERYYAVPWREWLKPGRVRVR